MSLLWRRVLGLVAWAGALLGALNLGRLPGDTDNLLCGPWGCTTSLQALAALHVAWLVLVGPVVLQLVRRAAIVQLRRLGIFLVAAGAVGALAAVLWHALLWLPDAPPAMRQYLLQKSLLEIARLGEVPILPAMVVGIVCWSIAKIRQRRGVEQPRPPLSTCEDVNHPSPDRQAVRIV